MIDTSSKGWDSNWSIKNYEKVGKLANDRDIRLITTIWPEPNKPYFNRARQNVVDFLKAGNSSILESDMEFNWKPERSSFKTWDEAAKQF